MAITKQKKDEILQKVSNALNSEGMVFVNFHGLGVSDSTEMRIALKESGVNYFVAKKTLVKKAIADKKFEGETPELEGELALVYGDDQIAPAREIYEFTKKYKDSISILGGIFEGKIIAKDEMMVIATIPPLNVLHAQFVNIINSPIQGVVMALDQIAKKKA